MVLAARRYRIELMFTTLGIGLGKLALPIIVARAVIRRNHLELLAAARSSSARWSSTSSFKEGADVHIFWPHYFAPYFALAIGALAASVSELTAWAWERLGRPEPARGVAGRAVGGAGAAGAAGRRSS